MNKKIKTALAVALVLILTGAMLIGGEVLRGTDMASLIRSNAFTINVADLGVSADYTACKSGKESFSPDEVKRIDLSWIAGSVKMEQGPGKTITFAETASRELTDGEKLRWKLENGTLTLRYCANGQRNVPEKDLVLSVPADWNAEWIDVSATSADLELRGLKASGKLEVGVTSGKLRMTDCTCGRLEATATSGDMTLTGCSCRKLEAGSTSGDISVLRCGAEEMKLGCTSGDIRCEDLPARCELDCDSTSGSVRVSLQNAQNDQRIVINTTSGDVYLDVPGAMDLDYDSVSGDLRGNLTQSDDTCPRVEVDTVSGDLILGAF